MKTLLMILMFVSIGIIVQAQDTTKSKTKVIGVEVQLVERIDSVDANVIWRDSVTMQLYWHDGVVAISGLGYYTSRVDFKYDTTYVNRTFIWKVDEVTMDSILVRIGEKHVYTATGKPSQKR